MIKYGSTVTNRRDRPNDAKGFYEYDVEGKTSKGEDFTLYLVEECFQDWQNERTRTWESLFLHGIPIRIRVIDV